MTKKWQYELIVPHEYNNKSIREYLSRYLLIPKHLIFNLRTEQRVLVNQKYLPMNFPIKTNDKISLTFFESDFSKQIILTNSKIKIDVLYEDDDLIIVNKPRGIKTHHNQPNENTTLINYVADYLKPKQPYMIHRLDQETSGAIIFAKNPVVVPILVEMIKQKSIKRNYTAWIKGHLKDSYGTIHEAIGFHPSDQRKRQINGSKAKNAITHYQLIKSSKTNDLVQISLETGRTHQIRVHFAYLDHPLLSDPLYNPETKSNDKMLLHSSSISLTTPFYHHELFINSPIPNEFK
ncbi:RluA family pseudouridine synthase [Lactobacillus sp. S2-2]|uniref:RluA family pseudouridine synthase n=1 Tax=Lactobacillus sp. S2-2 TaxID=2692917 RepID=UPI001F181B07|nr:RluA family pseudouridine synthase [Lactobacillus sp. S2-2]MCF6515277.1 RluA family pseudouridine synthase [Lactobacillus sp. S2-2]